MCTSTKTTTRFIKKDQPSASASSSMYETVYTTTAASNPEPIEIDISALSAQDLQSLKQDDPFLYYSIPVVRKSAYNFEEPDVSRTSLRGCSTVERRTRVSYECHSDLLLMDDLKECFEEKYDESALDQMDLECSKMLGLAYAAYEEKK